jgi:UTP--glucose-1-phosphate uridylyltransferase
MSSRPRKAVFPVGGFGIGMLPATKAAPKELLAVVDKPLIHYAVEEAVRAGLKQLILVTRRGKRAIEDHFDKAYELESALALHNRYELLSELRRLFPRDVSFQFVRQSEPLGIGHAILCARMLIGEDPFVVIIPDELVDGTVPASAQLIDSFDRFGLNVVGVAVTGGAECAAAGRLEGTPFGPGLYRIAAGTGHSIPRTVPLAVAGRFVLGPDIFDYLETTAPGPGGEVELGDALRSLAANRAVFARELEGRRFDCGSKLGYLAANLHFGLRHPVIGESFAAMVCAAADERRLAPVREVAADLHAARAANS